MIESQIINIGAVMEMEDRHWPNIIIVIIDSVGIINVY